MTTDEFFELVHDSPAVLLFAWLLGIVVAEVFIDWWEHRG